MEDDGAGLIHWPVNDLHEIFGQIVPAMCWILVPVVIQALLVVPILLNIVNYITSGHFGSFFERFSTHFAIMLIEKHHNISCVSTYDLISIWCDVNHQPIFMVLCIFLQPLCCETPHTQLICCCSCETQMGFNFGGLHHDRVCHGRGEC